MKFDYEKAQASRRQVRKRIYALQDKINREVASQRPALRAFLESSTLAQFIPQLVEAFCAKRRTVKTEVEETSWQAMRWNGKRWVKSGKRMPDTGEARVESEALVRHVKMVMRSTTPQVETLADVRRFSRDSCRSECRRACALVAAFVAGKGTPARRGELASLLGLSLKIRASGRDQDTLDEDGEAIRGEERDANWFLYRFLQLPEQFVKVGNKNTNRLASDDEAVITAWTKTKDRRAIWFLTLKRLMTQMRYLDAKPDRDGRIRAAFNLVATPTGRMACYGSPTGSSKLNLQTVGKQHRGFFVADEGHFLYQRDLSGSDAWGVAAFCAMHGDNTMLEDNRANLKPAKILALIYEQGEVVNTWDRDRLKIECAKVDGEGWLYFACKRVLHGCYTAGHELLTPEGWVPIEALPAQSQIACYDLDTREVHFERPLRMTKFVYTGGLYSFEGHSLSLEVTADHKMPYTTRKDNTMWITAAEISKRTTCRLPTAGMLVEGDKSVSIHFAQLIAAIHSDGHYSSRDLSFHFTKTRKIERIQMLLKANGLPFRVYVCKEGKTQIHVTNRAKVAPFKRWGKAATHEMLPWGGKALQAYVNEYVLWDGNTMGKVRRVFAKAKEQLEWIDTFAHLTLQNGSHIGRVTSELGINHKMGLNRRTYAGIRTITVKQRETKGELVYCPTVSTGYVMVRRNGRICVSGNSNYGMGRLTMSRQILTDSYKLTGKPIFLDPATCQRIQEKAFFVRYPGVRKWHNWMQRELKEHGILIASTGFMRRIYGRKDDPSTLQACLAHFPQYFTTYAIKKTLHRQWYDPENRHADGSLRVEPLLLVHDSNVGQAPLEEMDFAKRKLPEWFDNPLQIAHETITIPASSTWGLDWKNQDNKL